MPLRFERIVRLVGLLCAVAALTGCSTLRMIEPVLSPPTQFQLDRVILVEFVGGDAVGQRCAERGVTYLGLPGFNSGSCGSSKLITMPDPCAAHDDAYARDICAGIGGLRSRQVTIAFVHPDLAEGRCRLRNEPAAVVCTRSPELTAVNPCLTAERGWYSDVLCHELAHANGWAANHAGGSYVSQPSFVKLRLGPEDVLSPEAVRVALLAKAGKSE